MSTPDLSACPFCGGTDLRFGEIQEMEVGMSWPDYFVQCRSCQGSAGSGSRKEIAAEKWNRRVVPARIAQLEAVLTDIKDLRGAPPENSPQGEECPIVLWAVEAAEAALKETP